MMEDGWMESERYVVRDEKIGVKRGRDIWRLIDALIEEGRER